MATHVVKFRPMEVSSWITTALDMSVPNSAYRYREDGSVVTFSTPQLKEFISMLNRIVNDPDVDKTDKDSVRATMVHVLKEAGITR